MNDNSNEIYALTGANGHLGRLSLNYLMEQVRPEQIVASTRNPELLSVFAEKGVMVRHADFNDPQSLVRAFSGVTRLFIISSNASFEKRTIQKVGAIEAAVESGVKHITSTSLPNHGPGSPVIDKLVSSGISWAALGMNIWMDGVPYFLNSLRIGERIMVPEGTGKPCWVSHEDYARTCVSVLAGKAKLRGFHEVTGPESLGLSELAQRWSEIHRRKLEVCTATSDKVIESLVDNGMNLDQASGIVGYCEMFKQFEIPVSGTVEKATGISPASVDEVLRSLTFLD